jgi:prolyl-tRNA synthetase
VRAGYIRRLSSGVYTWLPLGRIVLRRVETIIREEIEATGAQELLLPVMQPIELWEQSGRTATMEDVLFRVEGRGGEFALGATGEEAATLTVSGEVDSYRDLPVTVYQVQLKYRDEPRPRFGVSRGREFLMMDAYSFDASKDRMISSYEALCEAYRRIFTRLGLDATPVEAVAGAIGGDVNHEWMVPSPIGEDHFARCEACGYAANTERAEAGARPANTGAVEDLITHHTPDRPGIDLVVEHFASRGLTAAGMLKCLALLDGDNRPVVVLVPGDREVRVPDGLRPFDDADFAAYPELAKGYIGPMGLRDKGVRVLADHAVAAGGPWVTGANQPDHHVTGATLHRDFDVDEFGSYAVVASGDPCPRCGQPLDLVRAVEAGHTFQLGLHYSTKLAGATFLDEEGKEQPFWMGCYGIGVTRAVAVVAEAHHDDAGLIWPPTVAPFDIHLISLGRSRNPDVVTAADSLYERLIADGNAVLYDDRDVSPGVAFADADLLGIPIQLVVGAKGLARGVVEKKIRATGERSEEAISRQ